MASVARKRESAIRSTVRYSVRLCHVIIQAYVKKNRNDPNPMIQLRGFHVVTRIRTLENDVVFGFLSSSIYLLPIHAHHGCMSKPG